MTPPNRCEWSDKRQSIVRVDEVGTGSHITLMRSIDIKTLENKLSEYIRLASQGETVLVTDRDRVVAEISAPKPGRTESVTDAVLADAVRKGWLKPPVMRGLPLTRNPVAPLDEVLTALADEREER
jgi:antitoxin (DNA-binding transcriptional repressor) of toxin-antitoxin stability system